MTDVVPSTGLTEWKPDLGPLPEGWRIMRVTLIRERGHYEAEIEIEGGHHHFLRLRLHEGTGPVAAWLHPFLAALGAVPAREVSADIDLTRRW